MLNRSRFDGVSTGRVSSSPVSSSPVGSSPVSSSRVRTDGISTANKCCKCPRTSKWKPNEFVLFFVNSHRIWPVGFQVIQMASVWLSLFGKLFGKLCLHNQQQCALFSPKDRVLIWWNQNPNHLRKVHDFARWSPNKSHSVLWLIGQLGKQVDKSDAHVMESYGKCEESNNVGL